MEWNKINNTCEAIYKPENNAEMSVSNKIANAFNNYFSNIGSNLANSISIVQKSPL
jgi:hypothetical protein